MRKVLFIAFTLTLVSVRAQVSIQPSMPAMGIIQKSQLWSVLIVNSSTQMYECRIDIVLRDRSTGQEILTGTSKLFTMGAGSKMINFNTASPVSYNYIVPGVNNSLQGLIPAGNYIACYALTTALKETPLAEECIQFDAEPLSPPMLAFPADSAVLTMAPTQFSWTPPTPASMFDQLQYEVIITPIEPGQTPEQAIAENESFFNDPYLVKTTLSYPAASATFENNKWYAWQVVAKDDRMYAGKTEVWVFTVKPATYVQQIIEQAPYIRMKKGSPENGIAPNGQLKLSYINETADSIATIRITEAGNPAQAAATFNIRLRPGENLIQYDLKNSMKPEEGKIYEAQLLNSRKEKWIMQFRHRVYEEK